MAGLRDVIDTTQPRKLSPLLQDIYGSPMVGDPIQEAAIQNTGDFGRGLRSAVSGSLSGAQRYVGANEAALENQLDAQQWAPEIATTDQVDGFGTGIRYVAGKVGGAAGSLPIALAGGVGGRLLAGAKGAYVGSAAAYQPVMAGGHMQDLDANKTTAGMSEMDKRIRATLVSIPQAAVEGVGPGYMINRFAKPQALLKPGFGEAVKRGAGVLATDAALEGAGAAASDVMGQGSLMQLDPTLAYNPRQTFEAGIGEAIGGAGMGAVHAPLTVAHDYMNAGTRGAADLAKRGARATPGVVEDALTAGKAGVEASGVKDLFRTSADFHAQHPELEGLLRPPTIPDSWATAPLAEQTAYMNNYEAERNASARTMAERMLADENTSNADMAEARALLESTDPKAWEAFAKGVKGRQVRDNLVDAIGSAASSMKRRVEAFGEKLGDIKHNKEQTPQDLEFRAALQPAIHAATGMGDDIEVVHNASLVLRDFVLGRFGDKDGDGVVDVPHGLVRAFGDNTAGLVAKAYDTLRRQGLTKAFDADAPMLLKEVNDVIKERKPLYKSAEQAVSDNLTPTALTAVPESLRSDMASTIAQYIDRGKLDERFEAKLDQWFGPNKEQVLSQIDRLHQSFRGTAKYGEDKAPAAYGDEGHGSDQAVDEGFESPTTNVEAGVNYHMGDGTRAFDKDSPYYADNVKRAQAKLTDGSQATTYDAKAGSDVVRHEMISVGQHAKDSGDSALMAELMAEHGLSEKEVNQRFQVMRTRDKMPDDAEPVDLKPWELAEPKNKDGVANKRSWADTESIRKMVNGKPVVTDTSTIAHGRIFLSRKSSDLVKSASDETLPKTFVTSAQKLIGKMLERKTAGAFDEHTAEMTGPQQKLAMFAAGLTSLMNSGKFHDEIQIKMPDGTMKVVNGLKSLPDDFVLYQGKDFKVTMKDALGTTDKATRAEEQKKVWKDKETGKDGVKKEVMPKAPSEKFEISDIPTMTRDELRAEYAATKKSLDSVEAQRAKLAEDSPEREKLVGIREGLQAKLETLKEAGEKRVDNRAPGERKETAGDVGKRTEGVGRTEHHGIGESEEMAASAQKKHDNKVRTHDEATGEELHPKQTLREKIAARKAAEPVAQTPREKIASQKLADDEAHRNQKIEAHKDSIERLRAKLDGLKAGRVQEQMERSSGQDRSVMGAESEAAHLKGLIAEHEAQIRLAGSAPMAGAVGVKQSKEKTGLSDNRPMNDMAAIEAIYHLIGKDVNASFATKGSLSGSGAWGRDAKTGQAIIRIAANALDPMSVAYHESMHEFFQRALDDKNLGGIHDTLRKAASSELVLRQMQRHFAGEAEVLKDIESDPAERVAYMFQLWAAGKLHVGPQTATVFRKLIDMIKKVLGMMTADQKALEIMQEFAAGNMPDRGAMARVLNTQEARGAYLRKVGTAMKPVVERGAEIVGFAENILADSGNPALIRLGKMFNNKTGSQGDEQGLLSAEAQAQNKYMNEFAKALRHGDKEDVRLAMEGLQKKEDHADPIVRKIQEEVKQVFRDMYTYMEGAGVMRWDEKAGEWVPVKKIDDYRLPVSWDASKIIANSEKFKALLFEHHEEALNKIADQANAEVAAKKDAGKYTASWEELQNPTGKLLTAEDIANALVNRVISTNGQVEFKESEAALGFSPFAKAVNERTLSNWINAAAFAEFQEKDMALILTTYVGQATKRAEYSRRFGPDGGKLQDEMNTAWEHEVDKIMKEKHKVDGAVAAAKAANPAEWETELGKLAEGVDGKEVVTQAAKNLEPARRAVMAMEGTLGHDISPLARKVNAYSIVYQNMRLLGYAMFSNIVDPLGIVVRGGEFKDAYSTFKRGMRDVGREWGALTGLREAKPEDRDEAVEIAEMIGTVDSSAFMSTMGNMYGSQYLGKFAREANDSFFRWNGMEAFNKAMRVGATQASISFIKRHHEKPNKHTERYFKELNLDPKDVKIGEDGRLNVENPSVQQAVMRWVDGAQLRPNAAMRPTMASDPHYASFYHLKQFMYAMQAVILKRVQVEIKNGNTDPLMLMFAGYVPVMLAADAAKGLLQVATGGGAPMWEHQGVAGVVAHGVQRAGLLGVAQMGVDVAEYGPLGLGGPTVEQIGSAVTDPLGKTVAEAVAMGPTNMMLRGTNWDN